MLVVSHTTVIEHVPMGVYHIEESEAESLDYQRAVEDTEYCERHEPTYNSDDGSM